MIIKKVIIDNFKSIDHIELDVDKVGDSYTKIFVGVNESGKSNILEALSYFNAPEIAVSFDSFCNQKIEDREKCEIIFKLELENPSTVKTYHDEKGKERKINFTLENITKKIVLSSRSDHFASSYEYDVRLLDENLYVKTIRSQTPYRNSNETQRVIVTENEKDDKCVLLTNDDFAKINKDSIIKYLKDNEPKVTMWHPSPEYLLSTVNLHTFSSNIESNKPLKNIFFLSGLKDQASIADEINKINNHKRRSILTSKLNTAINNYVSQRWSNGINIVIEITETGVLSFLIKDNGKGNEHNRFEITERSQGAQHFLSLILSLSMEAANHIRRKELILIDEPETHLHPSGIRDLGKELLKVGNDNYVFLATHSPFIIDKSHKERHYIVKKKPNAITEIKRIKEFESIIDDEVLNDAFGINVYQDLLNPHSVLVEGASDKIILKKAFSILGREDIGITNGHGSNIDTLASKMNFDNISVFIVTDDDKDGQKYKQNILRIGGVFSDKNVFTIRDLVGDIVQEGTIEDALGKDYITSQFASFYNKIFSEEPLDFNLNEESPLLIQITDFLKRKKKFSKWCMDDFKKQVSENFNPSKTSFATKFGKLKLLAERIIDKMKKQ